MDLRRNLGYKLLSLALGVLLYATAEAQRNPRFPQDIIIVPRVEGIPEGMALRKEPGSLSVTVTGSSSAIQEFRDQASKAVVDLRNARPGTNRVPIRYQNDPAKLEVSGPVTTEVTLEKKASGTFAVDVLYNNTPPPGLTYNDPVSDPPSVRVSGLASDVSRVVRVAAFVDNNDASGVTRRAVDLVAQNGNREVIDGVEITPPRVRVTITTRKTPATKLLLLSAETQGAPAPGFALVGYRFDPPSLTVSGMQTTLGRLSSLPVRVRVDGIRASETREVSPRLPPDLSLGSSAPRQVRLFLDVRPLPATPATPAPTTPTPTPTPVTPPITATPTPIPERNP